MKSYTAWAPGNISLLFKVMPNENPSKAGSVGSGFTINEGATVRVEESTHMSIQFNNNTIDLPTVSEVIRQLTPKPIMVSITSPLPLGSGFGMSGASALAAAHATNALFKLNKTERELATFAHTAEVIHKTGLGDVGNQWKGGCCVKFVSSALFQMTRLPFAGTVVYARSWGKIPTPSILKNKKLLEEIDTAGDYVLKKLQKIIHMSSFSFQSLLEIANEFTSRSNLLSFAPHARNIIQKQKYTSMIILGDAVVSLVPFEGSNKLTIVERGVTLV